MTCTAARHGTLSASGCRCPQTRALRARYRQRWLLLRRRGVYLLPSSVGTARRVQALFAVGWTSRDIATAGGWRSGEAVTNLLTRRQVQLRTARRIADVYDRLSVNVGTSECTRRRAAAKGYAPPEAWTADTIDDPSAEPWSWDTTGSPSVDEVAVQRALAGEHVSLPRDERGEALVRLIAAGLTPTAAGRRLRLSGASTRALIEAAS